MVRAAEGRGVELTDLTPAELAALDPALTPDVRDALTVEAALAAHDGPGGTAPDRVAAQLAEVHAAVERHRDWVAGYAGPRF
jgi:argininosuccinate lyase